MPSSQLVAHNAGINSGIALRRVVPMNPQMQQAKAALSSLAESQRAGKGIDLASLPEPLRIKLQAQLDKLPPELRKELLERGSPILDRAIERARQKPAQPANYGGHFNQTVQQGDRMQLTIGRVLLLFAIAAVAYFFWFQSGAE